MRERWGFKSHQLSGFSCVSMSTRQIGHFLLVASHWSTQPWWKRCMQGNLLGEREGQRDTGSMLIHIGEHDSPGVYSYALAKELLKAAGS